MQDKKYTSEHGGEHLNMTPNGSLHHNESNNLANLLGIAAGDYIGLIDNNRKKGMQLDSNKASTTLGESAQKFFRQ